jgi:asparagine synthase (glutamine-hydrolysing)
MCGICGIYNYKNRQPVQPEQILTMSRVMAHRGPDDEGNYLDGFLGLGHRRLSILDTSCRGHQPMSSEDGEIVIIFNGEIYNYLELRDKLAAKGCHFTTGTDTEVILQMYRLYKEKCLEQFIGMFAFAIWDQKNQELFLARDRLGVKPLYFSETEKGFVFSSEIKALLATGQCQRKARLDAIDRFMTYGYTPGVDTVFEGVTKLPPGHWMLLSNGKINIQKYWEINFQEEEKDRGEAYYIEALRHHLLEASRIRLRSDVPLGVFLSGGIDSSSVVALLARDLSDPIKTFSVAFDKGKKFDETPYAKMIAQKFHTDHHEFYVDPREFQSFIPKFVWFMDEPVTESAAIPLYFIAKLAKEYVTVVLSGEGADEMLAGYPIYHYMKVLEKYRRVPQILRDTLINPVLSLVAGDKLRKYIRLSDFPLEKRYLGVSLYDLSMKERLYSSGLKESLHAHDSLEVISSFYQRSLRQDILNRMLHLDINSWLVDDILIKADRMSMAASLELRSPFLDTRLAEFAASLPVKYKLKGKTTKYLLKKAMEGILPNEIIYREKKGFPTPLQLMFQNELRDYARQLLTEKRTIERGYFNSNIISNILDEHGNGAADHHKIIWQLIVLEEWHRTFMD